ncbi:MAG TPA: hypothetical protein VNZ04_03040, partial [Trinickia sp.]|nr:hypothetical protein [Trinickia sp.]
GGMGAIHILSAPNGKSFIGKESKPGVGQEFLSHEYEALKRIYSSARKVPENIVPVCGIADIAFPTGPKRLLIMEKIDGPDGVSLMCNPTIQRLPEADKLTLIRYIIHSLLKVANHAKCAGVVHNDIKPDNFMFDRNGILKVIDWGGWGPAGGAAWAGTRGYEAPESRRRHIETVIVPRVVSEPRSVWEAVTVKKKGFLGFSRKRTTYRYRSYMHTEVRNFQEQHVVGPCADEKSDVFSIGVVLRELMDELQVKSPLGEALYRGMTVLDRKNRLDINGALNKQFLGSVNVRKATTIVKKAF